MTWSTRRVQPDSYTFLVGLRLSRQRQRYRTLAMVDGNTIKDVEEFLYTWALFSLHLVEAWWHVPTYRTGVFSHALHATMLAASANTYSHATPTIFGIRSNISPKLLEIETWNLVHDFVSVMPSASGSTNNYCLKVGVAWVTWPQFLAYNRT